MTQRDVLLALRRRCEAALEREDGADAGGLQIAIGFIDEELGVIPPLVTEPSPDMDSGGQG